MAGKFNIFEAYSGRRWNAGLIPGCITAFPQADLLGKYWPYPFLGPYVRRTKVIFSSFDKKNRNILCFGAPTGAVRRLEA